MLRRLNCDMFTAKFQAQIVADFEERFRELIKYLNDFPELRNFSIKFGELGSRKNLKFVVEGRLGNSVFGPLVMMWRGVSSLLIIHPRPFDLRIDTVPSMEEISHISKHWDQICARTKHHVSKVLNLTTLSDFIIPQRGYYGDTGPR